MCPSLVFPSFAVMTGLIQLQNNSNNHFKGYFGCFNNHLIWDCSKLTDEIKSAKKTTNTKPAISCDKCS